jgi:hypothetical protein
MSVDRSIAALMASVIVVVVGFAAEARAQRVALVRPADDDLVLVDAFNRLRAELHIHEFETSVLDAAVPTQDPDALAAAAQSADALASIAFVRQNGKTSVEIWLADRVSGKVTMRTLSLSKTDDASSVLAIRAVDLLRASLRELDPGKRPPADVVGVDRRPIPEAVTTLAAPPTPAWTLRAEAVAIFDGPRLWLAYGPSLGVFHSIGDRVDLGVALAGPLLGASWKTSEGSASVGQELGWAELRVHALRSRWLKLGGNLALGEHYLRAQGQAISPLLSRTDQVWSFVGALGVHAEASFIARAAIVVSVRALMLTPRPGLGIGQRTAVIGLPVLNASAGIMLGF